MGARLIRRPAIDLLCGRTQCLSLNTTTRRYESSYRRTKQRLNVRPDSSMILSNNSPKHDHIIFNPPSSAPSVLHTPLKFLPKEDKRRQLLTATSSKTPGSTRLPPLIPRTNKIPSHHLTDADIAEIQRLRTSDPVTWSVLKLARKFNCSSRFIIMCASAPEKAELEQKKVEAVRAKWGPRRTKAREDRVKRRELILKDE